MFNLLNSPYFSVIVLTILALVIRTISLQFYYKKEAKLEEEYQKTLNK